MKDWIKNILNSPKTTFVGLLVVGLGIYTTFFQKHIYAGHIYMIVGFGLILLPGSDITKKIDWTGLSAKIIIGGLIIAAACILLAMKKIDNTAFMAMITAGSGIFAVSLTSPTPTPLPPITPPVIPPVTPPVTPPVNPPAAPLLNTNSTPTTAAPITPEQLKNIESK